MWPVSRLPVYWQGRLPRRPQTQAVVLLHARSFSDTTGPKVLRAVAVLEHYLIRYESTAIM